MLLYLLSLIIFSANGLQEEALWKGRNGSIKFTSDAPLELIQAESNDLSGVLNLDENKFAFLLPTTTFEGFNSPLQQEHFHENYMESEKYPKASFSGKFIEDIDQLEEGIHSLRAKGTLAIHGIAVERIIKCKVTVKKKEILIESDFVVPLADHKISIPQIVHQKIAEEIFVAAKIRLQPS